MSNIELAVVAFTGYYAESDSLHKLCFLIPKLKDVEWYTPKYVADRFIEICKMINNDDLQQTQEYLEWFFSGNAELHEWADFDTFTENGFYPINHPISAPIKGVYSIGCMTLRVTNPFDDCIQNSKEHSEFREYL